MIADASSPTPAGVAAQSAKPNAMTIHEASRTLLKSPPELWAECSDAASLSRHLGQFGEIKITRLEPETAVAWEGEQVSGTVRLEPSGWGTRVILTAEEAEVPDLREPAQPVAESPGTVEPIDAGPQSAEPGSVDAVTGKPDLAIVVDHAADAAESVEPVEPPDAHRWPEVDEPDMTAPARPTTTSPEDTDPPAPRKGLLARFFARMRGPLPEPETTAPAAEKSLDPAPEPSVEPRPEKTVRPEPSVTPKLRVEPEATLAPEPTVQPEPTVEPEPSVARGPGVEPGLMLAPEQQPAPEVSVNSAPTQAAPTRATETALKDALESLGAAHHRPFSRS